MKTSRSDISVNVVIKASTDIFFKMSRTFLASVCNSFFAKREFSILCVRAKML